ncbi:DUF6931 family protein [Bradyrhizobium sp. AUGA SZCCT0182]|uniref:DUF6931 family protein n=1 Tax=Bradyrhizobium sp. AUGA SZCCT0182 TaxID=2807667 RepID=UPI001BAA5CD8|nr:hypothetical protein [Bradyrhizobium sp. AUGA SZCCT0182]MBR1232065.1 hypothetical protein [Bradyrhizobium sp. AUGA SZCCT0182]
MSHVRFATVRDLFDSFPSAASDVGAAKEDLNSLEFLKCLVGDQEWQAAISFCAYLLSRRAAVAWASRSVRRMMPAPRADEERLLGFAEAWITDPEEPRRRKALSAGTVGDVKSPATWVALAAGWSGGSVVPEEMGYAPADPEQTPKAVRVAMFIALSRIVPEEKQRVMTACLHDGIQLASGGQGSPL